MVFFKCRNNFFTFKIPRRILTIIVWMISLMISNSKIGHELSKLKVWYIHSYWKQKSLTEFMYAINLINLNTTWHVRLNFCLDVWSKNFFVLMKYVPSQVFEKTFLTLCDLFWVPEIFSLQTFLILIIQSILLQEMPKASIANRKLTNIGVGGDSIMGIRRVPEDDTYADPTLAGDAMEKPITRPLRYTPGLKCDAHLESLRPERASNHRAIQVCRKMYSPW